jgi:cation diffusion facilitator family transporter
MSAHGPGARESSLKLALAFCIIDLALMGTVAFNSNSVTILGDVLKEATDTLAVLAAFLTVRAVRRSPNHRFAYGIGKLENLVSIAIGGMMVLAALYITAHAAQHLQKPLQPEGTLPGVILFGIYAIISFVIWMRTRAAARAQPSAIMQSQAKLWFAKGSFDTLMGGGLLFALLFRADEWAWYIDPIASLVGVCFLLHAAWGMTSSSVPDLLDAAVEETVQIQIMRGLVQHIDAYERILKVRSRRSGPHVYVEIFLEFEPELRMREVQSRIEAIRADLEERVASTQVLICPASPPVAVIS